MNRLRLPSLLVAILLVLIMPLEQGRCMCGNLLPHATHTSMRAPMAKSDCQSSCCDAPAAPHSDHHDAPSSKAPQGCACSSYSAGVLPMAPSVAGNDFSVVAFVLLPSLLSVEPVTEPREHPPALDVGSPPLPVSPGAHGLRAPPVLA